MIELKPDRYRDLTKPENAVHANKILLAASADPVTLQNMCDVTGLKYQTAFTFMRTLVYNRQLFPVGRCGGATLYSTNQAINTDEITRPPMKTTERRKLIMDYVREHAPVSVRDISITLRMPVPTIYNHIQRLAKDRRVVVLGQVRNTRMIGLTDEDGDQLEDLKAVKQAKPAPEPTQVRRMRVTEPVIKPTYKPTLDPFTLAMFGRSPGV